MAPRSPKKRVSRARWTHRSAVVTSTQTGAARLAIISDTHSQAHPDAARLVADLEPDAILHAGDVGQASVLEPFRRIAPTLIAVRGNIDQQTPDLPDSVDIRVDDPDGRPLAKLLLQHICVYGPKLRADAAKRAASHDAQVVVCGHSHVPFIGRDRGLYVFNPGSIGPRRFALPIVFGVMELAAGRVSMTHISCETGQRWTPMPSASAPNVSADTSNRS